MTILVTGASGHLGRLAIERLIARGVPATDIVGGARTPSKADLPVRVVELDYDRPDTIAAALPGVEKVLLVSASELGKRVAQHSAVIDAAKAAGVKHLVYTSAPRATTTELVLAAEHKATEEAITASGIPATILRNNWYNENYGATLEQAAATGEIVASVGAGKVASASREDYADAAAVALIGDDHVGKVYELGGDHAWQFEELAAAAAEVLGRPVVFRSVSTEEHAEILKAAGLDEGTIGFVTALDANIRDGALDSTGTDLSTLIGRPTTPLIDSLRAIAGCGPTDRRDGGRRASSESSLEEPIDRA